MSTQAHSGYLVLADISGFTSYVAQTELAHSQEILAELLELIVRQTRPVLTLSKLEGNAVFAYSTDQPRLDRDHWLSAYHCVIFEPQDDGQGTRIVYRLKMQKPTLFNRLAAKAMAIILPGFFNRMSRYVKNWLATEAGTGVPVPTVTT